MLNDHEPSDEESALFQEVMDLRKQVKRMGDQAREMGKRIGDLQAERDKLRAAVRFYANEDNWTPRHDGIITLNAIAIIDAGKKAREVISSLGG